MINKKELKEFTYSIFSDTTMVLLALAIVPVVALQFFYPLNNAQALVVTVIDLCIWSAFLLELVLKIYVEENKAGWIKKNKLDTTIGIIVIFSPVLEFVAPIFGGAAALRLLRLSRLIRLAAISSKTSMKWRKVNLKSYALVAIIVALGFIISLFKPAIQYYGNDVSWLSAFISVMGIVYALISAFTIAHVWNEFNSLEAEIRKEATVLRNIVLLAEQFTGNFGQKTKKLVLDYLRSNVATFWSKTEKIEENRNKLIALIKLTDGIEPKDQKDAILLENIIGELRAVSAARSNVMSLVNSKTPNIVWFLLGFTSLALLGGITLMNFQNQLLSTVVIVTVSIAVALITVLVYDMDFPFQAGFWVITPRPYFELEEFIEKGHY